MTILTLTTALVVVYGIVSKRYERALAIGAITPAGAALVVDGPESLPTFYAVALGGAVLLAMQWWSRGGAADRPRLTRIPGVALLLALLGWAALVALLAPLAFPGTAMVTVQGGVLVPGVVGISGLAQLLYLALGIVVVVVLARSQGTAPSLLALTFGVGIGLALWRYASVKFGVPFPEGLFANSPTFRYIENAAGGVPRFRGIHSEPSGLALTTIAAAAYGLSFAVRVRGVRRVAALALAAAAIFLGVVSTSTTFLVAGVVLIVLAGLVLAWRLMRLHVVISRTSAVLAVGAVGIAIAAVPALFSLFATAVEAKLGTDSFDDRSTSDAQAFDVFLDSWGMGIGLGAVRASSLAFTLLGAVGVIGVLLFAGAVAAILLPSLRLVGHAPVVWALVATLVARVIASPDLSDPSGVLWLSLGILAHGIVVARQSAAEHRQSRAPRSIEARARSARHRLRREAEALAQL